MRILFDAATGHRRGDIADHGCTTFAGAMRHARLSQINTMPIALIPSRASTTRHHG
jgi:hypothetical protein